MGNDTKKLIAAPDMQTALLSNIKTMNYKDSNNFGEIMGSYKKIFYNFITILNITIIDSCDHEKQQLVIAKLIQYQKLMFSLRYRKSFLPTIIRNLSAMKQQKGHIVIESYYKKRKRFKILRFISKRYKKQKRVKKYIRLKAVHFFIPFYLQIDFRTLRVVKIKSPSQYNVFYPFRISLAKRYSFYRSKGF